LKKARTSSKGSGEAPGHAPLEIGQSITLGLSTLAMGGSAIGRKDNYVIFVPYGAPGDTAEVQITSIKRNYATGRLTHLKEASPHRVTPPCPLFGRCGGCQLQHIDYQTQLIIKKTMVSDALKHIGKIHQFIIRDTIAMKNPWSYRNKVQAVTGIKKDPDGKDRIPMLGLYEPGTHNVLGLESCLIQSELNNRVLQNTRALLEKWGYPMYDESSHGGAIRHIVSRTTQHSGEALVLIVSKSGSLPRLNEFAAALKEKVPEISGILLNINAHKTNVILGEELSLLWGRDHMVEEIGGLTFKISPLSFYQTNHEGLSRMLEVIAYYGGLKGNESVIDAYCGVGVFTLFLASMAGKAYGLEEIRQAVNDARENAARNSMTNVHFIEGQAEVRVKELSSEIGVPGLLVLDPPRTGVKKEFLDAIALMKPPRIIYVSCNPSTLARDLSLLAERHFHLREIQPIDMFPQTCQVETVACIDYEGGC
jgi:23S rRNA (uracil1939-C5)-methyltransferase